ncbi:MAG TPA: flagellar hook-basal body protein, partial [Chloroflexota bacterium]|nr:flagellar hook-basal body protein [Chloroflexota bacterium]
MIRGIQTVVSAMQAQQKRQEIMAKNLSNASTTGYKQECTSVEGFAATIGRLEKGGSRSGLALTATSPSLGSLGADLGVDRSWVDFRQGGLEQTQRKLDVALNGDGFLQVRTPDGDFYFRGGALQVDSDGRLVTEEGYSVLADDGQEIYLPDGDPTIKADGSIFVGDEPVASLSLVEFDPGTPMAKVGECLYSPDDPNSQPLAPIATTVKQGFLEQSNVDQISVMTEMVTL